jgi:hypothetical protein
MQLDRNLQVPLYEQIVNDVRFRIFTGDLLPGDRLPALRVAGEEWGVNLHTVRRAYRVLEESGLVETAATIGTTVRSWKAGGSVAVGIDGLLRDVLRIGDVQYGVGPRDVLARLTELVRGNSGDAPQVWIVECSLVLAEVLATQLREEWVVDVRAWSLARVADVPAGSVISTSFHREEILESPAARVGKVGFVRVRTDYEALLRAMAGVEVSSLILCDISYPDGHTLARDLGRHLERDVELVVPRNPVEALNCLSPGRCIIFAPGSWEQLPHGARTDPRALLLPVRILESDLSRIGQQFGWLARSRSAHGEEPEGPAAPTPAWQSS